ncbi:MAG: hypothetical protein AABX11_02350 [Nanoarchaeota archaeon]
MTSKTPRFSEELIRDYKLLIKAWPHKNLMYKAIGDAIKNKFSSRESDQQISGLDFQIR